MFKPRFYSILGAALAAALFALPAAADSQARIVRLSDVQGTVQIDKNSGLGFENAFDNLPIMQGTALRTRGNGRAEVEFEDGSTMRLTPNTTVEFSALALSDTGKRVSVVKLVEGKAYVNWLGKSHDIFTLNFSQEKVEVGTAAHFRATSSSSLAEISSFKNDLDVAGPAGTTRVGKNKVVAFDVNDKDRATVAKNAEESADDKWDEDAIEYHEQYARNNSNYGYGSSDLGYYGAYSNVAGYGNLWQPYFAGAGWDPFMDGAWSWYPGMGYLWASAYPWGWIPYLYGNWIYAPGFGWGWQPGSGFGTWKGGLHYVGAAVAGFHPPVAPAGMGSTVVVGRGGPVATGFHELIVVKNGSAGLGISRGAYDNLHHLNTQVAKTGSAELRVAPPFAVSSERTGWNGFNAVHGTEHGGTVSSASAGHASGASAGGHVSH